jgi:hypothetical protein
MFAGYTNLGCYMYSPKGPAGTDLTGSSSGKMSPAECYRLSSAYDFFALVSGNRCIGFNSLPNLAEAKESAPCSMPCTGAAATSCGGKASLQLYARNKPLPQLAPVTGEKQAEEQAARFASAAGHSRQPCVSPVVVTLQCSLHPPSHTSSQLNVPSQRL